MKAGKEKILNLKSPLFTATIKQYFTILLGIMMTAIAVSVFFVPNKIVTGGLSGISTIMFHQFHIPTGVTFVAVNLVLLIIALKAIGKDFVVKSLFGTGMLSLFVQLFSYIPPLTDDVLLATIFGAVFYGFGIGLVLVEGSTTGGTDILGRLLQCAFPHMKIGKLLLLVDSIVIILSLVVFKKVELTLFGIIGLFLSTQSIDSVIHMRNISKLAFVVSNDGTKIAKSLVSTSHRGITIIDVIGAYTMEKKEVLMCALKESELVDFQRKILDIDPSAFIIFSESQQIVGNGFRVYK